ncbi:MAG: hypothetical protein ABSA67_09010 [Candidatus Brocadiia bacterium]|jgi:hypothetical protein
MRSKSLMIFPVFFLPLVLGWGAARAADQQGAGDFSVLLSDGSMVKGAVSLVINLDTAYGKINIPSSALVSAQFDAEQKWAEIQLNDAQLKMRYNPASSDLKATTAVGPLTIALANVIKVAKGSVQVASETAPQAASPYVVQPQPSVPPPATGYTQQQPPAAAAPPTVVYQYPYQYQYVRPAPYYYSPYYYSSSYYSPYYYGWPGPYFGIGIGVGRGYGRFYGGFPGFFGFGIRIR